MSRVMISGLLLVVFIICFVTALNSGKYSLTFNQFLNLLMAELSTSTTIDDPRTATVFWQIRFPRTLAAIIIGGGLAIAGAAYQGMFRNPLVSPDILGVSAGAGVGAVIAIFRAIIGLYPVSCLYRRFTRRDLSLLDRSNGTPT